MAQNSKAVQAIWNGQVIAEADTTVMVEGNHYFPLASIRMEFLKQTETTTYCPWKGHASYYTITVDGQDNVDAVWAYPSPSEEAAKLKDHFAFWKDVEVIQELPGERDQRLSDAIKGFIADTYESAKGESPANILRKFTDLCMNLGGDGLAHVLPEDYVTNLGFFNYANSNNVCFHADRDLIIRLVNPTFSWALNHLPQSVGSSFEQLMSHMEVIEGPDLESFFKKIASHGWARIPIVKLRKGDEDVYYSLDVAITKHGDKDSLTGYQGQFTNITNEVELTQAVARSKANMQSLLAGLDDGLFYFDAQGVVAPERSEALNTILPGSCDYNHITELLTHFTRMSQESSEACLRLLWPRSDDNFYSDFNTTVSMLPQQVCLQGYGDDRYITFQYRPLENSSGALEKVLVIVTDITEIRRHQEESKKQEERIQKISRAAMDIEGFRGFICEMSEIAQRVSHNIGHSAQNNCQDFRQLKRDLHTLKGSVGTYGFLFLAREIHSLEERLGLEGFECKIDEFIAAWNAIHTKWQSEVSDVKAVLGLNEDNIMQKKISSLKSYVGHLTDSNLIDLVNSLDRYPIQQVFSKYAAHIEQLSAAHDYKDVQVIFSDESCDLAHYEVQPLDGALVHILRNCFDHGVEEHPNRQSAGKELVGSIKVTSHRPNDKYLEIIIQDDGGGIDDKKLGEKAVASGHWSSEDLHCSTQAQRLELIFVANLSSKDEVSELSGRGVGMDAVREIIHSYGGEIQVSTTVGQGSRFKITIPQQNLNIKKAA